MIKYWKYWLESEILVDRKKNRRNIVILERNREKWRTDRGCGANWRRLSATGRGTVAESWIRNGYTYNSRGKLMCQRLGTLFATVIRRPLAESHFPQEVHLCPSRKVLFFLNLILKNRFRESFHKLSPFLLSPIALFVVVHYDIHN